MRFVGDRRGQSVVIGTVILFGFLILALASYQAFVVPAENSEIEFDHNQDLQTDMEDLRNSLLDVRNPSLNDRSLDHRPVRVQLGTGYPTRVITVNPPPAVGTLRSQDDVANVSIENAAVSDARFDNADPLVDQSHPTSLLTYEPRYNEYREAPETTFEHSMLYNRFDGANLSVTGQRTINGDARTLNVVVYEGGVNEQQLRTTMDPETLDATPTSVPIESDGGPIRIELPTNSPGVWEEELADENNVLDIEPTADSVIVELDDQEDWDLRMTRVGFDGGNQGEHNLFESVVAPEVPNGGGTPAGNHSIEINWDTDAIENQSGVNESSDQLRVNRSLTGEFFEANGTVYTDNRDLTGATVDLSTTDPSVAWFTSSSVTSVDGQFTTEVEVSDQEGAARILSASGDGVSSVELDVFGDPSEADSEFALRIDDLSHENENVGHFITSFELENIDEESFDRVEVEYDYLSGDGQGQTTVIENDRGSAEYTAGGTAGGDFEITLTAIGTDESGDEFEMADRTVSTTADANNPVEDGLGAFGPSFEVVSFEDRSNQGQGPRYRVEYLVDDEAGFDRVEGYMVSLEEDTGGKDSNTNDNRDGTLNLNTYGNEDTEFKLVALVFDNDGVVVDAEITTDESDGEDP